MINQVHQHLLEEFKANTKTDRVFVLAALLLNFISVMANSGVAEESEYISIIFLVIGLTVVINFVALVGLLKGRIMRERILTCLSKIYQDNEVGQYYDLKILGDYRIRNILFIAVIVCSGIVSIAVPLILIT